MTSKQKAKLYHKLVEKPDHPGRAIIHKHENGLVKLHKMWKTKNNPNHVNVGIATISSPECSKVIAAYFDHLTENGNKKLDGDIDIYADWDQFINEKFDKEPNVKEKWEIESKKGKHLQAWGEYGRNFDKAMRNAISVDNIMNKGGFFKDIRDKIGINSSYTQVEGMRIKVGDNIVTIPDNVFIKVEGGVIKDLKLVEVKLRDKTKHSGHQNILINFIKNNKEAIEIDNIGKFKSGNKSVDLAEVNKEFDGNIAKTFTIRGKKANNEKLPKENGLKKNYDIDKGEFTDGLSKFENNSNGTNDNFEIKKDI